MSINKGPLLFAHSEGHTDLCYTEDGRSIITCGSDGDIRIWAGIDDAEPNSHCVGDAYSVAQKGDDIYVARTDGRVSILTLEGERNGTLARFTGAATHIAVGKNQPIIVCAAEDFIIKVFTSPQDTESTEFTGFKSAPLGVAISPDEDVIAASCGDGNIYIWNLKDKKLIKTIECVPRTNSFKAAKVLCRVSFNPKGKYFAYPHDKEVIIANVDNYEKAFSLKDDSIQGAFSIVQYSPCGNFIAASSINGDICIWRCKPGSSAVSCSHEQKYNICALQWHPEEIGEIVYCDVNGQIGSLQYIPSGENSISDLATDVDLNMIPAADIDPDDDVDDENVISLEKLKNETLGEFRSGSADGKESRNDSPDRPSSPPCNLQTPFQPGSTPSHLQSRFMAYNEIGIVRLFKDEDHETTGNTSIDVTFHDSSFNRNLFMNNHLNHSMATLSTAALALACETPSKLVCIPLKAGTKEWSVELSDLEEILCIASSSTLVALASNVRMLRVFSIFGNQRAVISVPGPVVSIAAKNNYICVVYHACTAHSKDQNLSGMLVQFDEYNVTSKIMPIPITPQSTLIWLGFTNVGSLTTFDSAGMLRICKLNSGAWIPVCDTTIHAKGVSDTYFIVSVNESSQSVQAIHCRGALYPAAAPLPLLLELPMQLPMCELDTDKTQLEDKIFRWSYFETEQNDKSFREAAIKLFALACKNDLDDRAFEILEIVNNSALITLAIKYAAKLGKHRLADKMKDLAQNIDSVYVANEHTPNASIRPMLNRHRRSQMKGKNQASQQNTQVQPCTPEILTNTNTDTTLEETQTNENLTNTTSEETQTKETLTNTTSGETQTKATPSPAPKKPKGNPFKKTANSNENVHNPLSLTNSNDVIDVTPTKSTKDKDKENKQTETKSNFQSWFNSTKAALEKEHPELSQTDLVKVAVKLFRKQAEKRKASGEVDNSQHKNKQSKLSAFAFSKK